MILATIALSAGFAFFLLLRFSRFVIKVITKFDYRLISLFTVVILFAIVSTITGLRGIFITVVATGIGLIPVLFHSRRMNCMAILLVHMTLSMFGVEPAVLKFFHLI